MKIKDHFLSQETFELQETSISGVLKTHPIPENLASYYESKAYISHHQDNGGWKEKLYKFAQSFNLNYKRNIVSAITFKNARVLDYGCGAGEFVKFIENDFETYGFEPNEKARAAAAKKTEKTKIIENIDQIKDQSLEVITLWHVFEHIENQDDILDKFRNKLVDKGILIIAVPNYTSFDARHYQSHWAAYDVPRHLYHFSKKGMQRFLEEKNWTLKKIKPLLLDSFYISILSEKYKKNPLFWLKGGIIGAISNFKASKNGEFSSLIYIIEKK
ncbi:class I SAM-dependent methyltransferase [Bergeyella sp. RCAD1439]|uniref:class I SAM-dependent methyltransferase n=1 Tax=Bergeyella anatis TaxID=3113737 RepID=UPI002E19D7F7|nr:class I SAM-dependent methyltransferase [Bergeyella sp. RCAD1439]